MLFFRKTIRKLIEALDSNKKPQALEETVDQIKALAPRPASTQFKESLKQTLDLKQSTLDINYENF